MTFGSAVKTFLDKFKTAPETVRTEFDTKAQALSKQTIIDLFTALDAHDFTAAEKLLAKNKNGTLLHFKDGNGTDPLMHMAQDGNLAGGDFLIRHGGAVREADNKGATALMYAGRATFNCEQMIDLLINAGANLSAKNSKGEEVVMDIIDHSGIKGATHILKNYGAGKGGVTLNFENPSIERALRVATMEAEFDFCALVEKQRKAQEAKPQPAATPQTPKG